MILYATNALLAEDLDLKSLFSVLNDWFVSSDVGSRWLATKHCSPFDTYEGQSDYADTAGSISLQIYAIDDAIGVKVEETMDDYTHRLEFIARDKEHITRDHVKNYFNLYVREEIKCVLIYQEEVLKRIVSTVSIWGRDVMQRMYWNRCLAPNDYLVPNTDKAIYLETVGCDDIINALRRVPEHKGLLPILYLPYSCIDMVRTVEREFVGLVHVVAAGSPLFAEKYKDSDFFRSGDISLKRNVLLFYYKIETDDYTDSWCYDLCTGEELVADPAKFVWDLHARLQMDQSYGIPRKYSIYEIREETMASQIAAGNELSSVFEAILKEKDERISSLYDELSEVRSQLRSEQSKAHTLQDSLDKQGDTVAAEMFEITEKPKYEHEIEDIILKVLEKERNGMSGDNALMQSRKYHVLCDILAHNFPSGTDAELGRVIKEVFASGKLTRDGIGCLQSAGFSVIKNDKQSHYKVVWQDDERYTSTYAATLSDFRGGKNAASDFYNLCFGY